MKQLTSLKNGKERQETGHTRESVVTHSTGETSTVYPNSRVESRWFHENIEELQAREMSAAEPTVTIDLELDKVALKPVALTESNKKRLVSRRARGFLVIVAVVFIALLSIILSAEGAGGNDDVEDDIEDIVDLSPFSVDDLQAACDVLIDDLSSRDETFIACDTDETGIICGQAGRARFDCPGRVCNCPAGQSITFTGTAFFCDSDFDEDCAPFVFPEL